VTDELTRLADLRRRVAAFVAARDWEQYHFPKNLSAAIAIEAAELIDNSRPQTVDFSRGTRALGPSGPFSDLCA